MSALKLALLAGALTTALSAAPDEHAPRQYYGPWRQHPQLGYHYRPYYYRPAPTYHGYRHHYVIYHPRQPQHYYFYNPYKKQFWGRCPVETRGRGQYSLLAERDRKGRLQDVPESAFPPPGGLPPIPESSDGAVMELPPDDLPAGEALPPGER